MRGDRRLVMKRVMVAALLASLFAGSAMADPILGNTVERAYRSRPQLNERDNRNHDRNRGNDHRRDGDNDHRRYGDNDHRRYGDNDHRRYGDNDHRRYDNDHRRFDRDHRSYRPPPPRYAYGHVRRAPIYYGVYHRPWGYRDHRWIRGERLPAAYYSPRYVIVDHGRCGLWAPPRGYHWVPVNPDAVLAVIATGLILDVAFDVFG